MYTNIRENSNWVNRSPNVDWVVFAIADNGDRDLLDDLVSNCLDKNVSYACSAGQLASVTEWLFDIGIVNKAIQEEDKTDKPYNYGNSPITTSHKNFSEDFWFATTLSSRPLKSHFYNQQFFFLRRRKIFVTVLQANH